MIQQHRSACCVERLCGAAHSSLQCVSRQRPESSDWLQLDILNQNRHTTGSILSEKPEGGPISLDDLQLLLVRESVTEPPQYFVQRWAGADATPAERRLSYFPHPYPSIRDLQKEILR